MKKISKHHNILWTSWGHEYSRNCVHLLSIRSMLYVHIKKSTVFPHDKIVIMVESKN